MTVRSADSERTLLERNSENKAVQVVADIDHEISTAKALLVALSNSHSLRTEDFSSFHQQSVNVAQQLGAQIVLREAAQGRQVMNPAIPWGQPIPQQIPSQASEAMNEAMRTGRPAISNVFFAPAVNRHMIGVGIPIVQNGAAAYYLSVGIPVDSFAQALQNAALPTQWVVTLVDRDNTIVARSENHDAFVGTKPPVDLSGRTDALFDGVMTTTNRLGVAYRWTLRRSEISGWLVAVGVPLEVLQAPAKTALTTYAAAAGTLFLLAIGLSFVVGGRLSQSIGEMGIDRKPTREEFSVLFESAASGVLVVDSKGLMLLANARMEQQFGYSRDELIGNPVEILIPDRYRRDHESLRQRFSGSPEARPMGAGRELFGRRKNGSEFPIETGLNPIATRSGPLIMVTVVDITMRVESEHRLSAALTERDDFRRRFMQAQENERLRLAHELHDQTGQSLTAALLELKHLELQLKDEGKSRARDLRKSMEQMGKVLHRIAWELRPASIDELGLTSGLANYVAEWSHQYSIEADFHCRDPHLDLISDEKRTAIFRIVQEALTNIAKHARQATSVSVVIDRSDLAWQLTIEDNGPGFDVEASHNRLEERRGSKLGLAGMRERLTLIGGVLEIETSPGAGTTLFARIPLDNERLTA